MKVLAFYNGRLAKCFDSFDECAEAVGVNVNSIPNYVLTGKANPNNWTFDIPLDGVDYEGWGFLS